MQGECATKRKENTYEKSGNSRGFSSRKQLVDQDDFCEDDDDDYMVLNVEGGSNDAKPHFAFLLTSKGSKPL